MALVTIASCGCATESTASPTNDTRDATYRCWQELKVVSDQLNNKLDSTDDPSDDLAKIAKSFADYAAAMNHAHDQLSDLAVADVDQRLIRFVARDIKLLADYSQLFTELSYWAANMDQTQKHANSWDASIESFLRGFFGDPMGKFNELNGRFQQLEQQRDALLARCSVKNNEWAVLLGELLQLRAELSRDFGCEFPSL